MDLRLFGLAGEGAHRFGVGDGVCHVPGEPVRGRLSHVDQLSAPQDERQNHDERHRQHAQQSHDEQRRITPQHDRDECQRHRIPQHLERDDVEDVLEPASVPKRALGERACEVVVKEREVFRQQLVHRFDVQRFEAAHLCASQ